MPRISRYVRLGALSFVGLVIVLYATVLCWFRYNENDLIFAPQREALSPPSLELKLNSRDVSMQSADGIALKARVIPPPESIADGEAAWLVYLHGASGNIGLPGYNEAWAQFRLAGLGVLAVDYRGFGESGGEISEAGLYLDAHAAYTYLRETLQVPPRRILIYGFSMGAAVAIELATRVEAAGLMVEGAWLSIPRVGSERYPYIPVSALARNRFASEDRIAHVDMPKLFVHAREDEIIPMAHGQRLFEIASPPKRFHSLGGQHGTSHRVDPTFFAVVRQFIEARGLPLANPSF